MKSHKESIYPIHIQELSLHHKSKSQKKISIAKMTQFQKCYISLKCKTKKSNGLEQHWVRNE